MLLNKEDKFCIYCYTERDIIDMQTYLYETGFKWEILSNTNKDIINKYLKPILPCAIFNFVYDGTLLNDHIVTDFISKFEDLTTKYEYKKYNARDILLTEKINKIKNVIKV